MMGKQVKICDKGQNIGFNAILNKYRFKQILNYIKNKSYLSCLEVGCGNGQMTNKLVSMFKFVEGIDADNDALNSINLHDNLSLVGCMIEHYNTYKKFDVIICLNFLEHIKYPELALEKLRKVGHKDTIYIFGTPNAYSFNRLIGVELGMMKNPTDLHEGDEKAGHYRIYTPIQFRTELVKAGFECKTFKTIFYKPLPNSDMELLPSKLIDKYLNMEPEHSGAEIFAVCKLGEI